MMNRRGFLARMAALGLAVAAPQLVESEPVRRYWPGWRAPWSATTYGTVDWIDMPDRAKWIHMPERPEWRYWDGDRWRTLNEEPRQPASRYVASQQSALIRVNHDERAFIVSGPQARMVARVAFEHEAINMRDGDVLVSNYTVRFVD